jgi:ATP-dependent DNA ligase
MPLPLKPPIEPMLAKLTPEIPDGDGWLYEPKWDGFRAIVFFDGDEAYIQSRDLKPLNRYFPELKAGLEASLASPMTLDGEVIIVRDGSLDFDALQMRIHPAESRVRMLADQTPSSFVAFDMLAHGDSDLTKAPFSERREQLTTTFTQPQEPAYVTPATIDRDEAQRWFETFEGAGLDGIIAKRLDQPYMPGARAMLKVKHLREADCVVGGFRWYKESEGKAVGSLLLGLYDDQGVLHHVGHTSSFKADEKRALVDKLKPHITDEDVGFGAGRTPGEPSRWTGKKDLSWMRLRPELVCEVSFDHLQGNRFRHAATFRRWRTDKSPQACTFDQLEATPAYDFLRIFER